MDQTRLWELAWLVAMGATAASAGTFWDWSLGIPGHAILRIVFPMTLGLALVPRHGGGVVMGASALGMTAIYASAGHGVPGLGAVTSLAVFGPILDAVLWRARRGWLLFGSFAVAGVASNMIAFAVRGGGRLAGVGSTVSGLARGARLGAGGGLGGGRGMGGGGGLGSGDGFGGSRLAQTAGDVWWLYAPFSYFLCGLLAGLLCAVIWFAVRPRRSQSLGGPQR